VRRPQNDAYAEFADAAKDPVTVHNAKVAAGGCLRALLEEPPNGAIPATMRDAVQITVPDVA